VVKARARYDESLRKQISEAHDRLGNALISLGDSVGAIREYGEALTSDSQSALAAVNLGIALARQKQTAEARKWLEDGLRMNPRQPAAQLVLGQILMAAGLREEGMAHLRLAASGDDPGIRSEAERLLKNAKR
jgi:tetratricopeptide (TPR) repeat protein